nr:hypothetical protein [Desulfobacula sp.]
MTVGIEFRDGQGNPRLRCDDKGLVIYGITHSEDNTKINGGSIYTGTIQSAAIAAGQIQAGHIAAGAVEASKINVSTLSAISANLGTVTAGNLSAGLITAGTLNADRIAAVSIDTPKLVDQAVSIPVSAFTAGGIATDNGVTYQSATIVSTGAPIGIQISMLLYNTFQGAHGFNIYRGSTIIATYPSVFFSTQGTLVNFSLSDTPGAGSVTYSIKGILCFNDSTVIYNRSMLLLETKK